MTYRLHYGYIQETFRNVLKHFYTFRTHSGDIQVTFTIHSSDIQVTFMIHSGDIQEFPETFLNIQDTFIGYSSYIQITFMIYLGDIQELSENFQIFKTHSGDVKVTCMLYSRNI